MSKDKSQVFFKPEGYTVDDAMEDLYSPLLNGHRNLEGRPLSVALKSIGTNEGLKRVYGSDDSTDILVCTLLVRLIHLEERVESLTRRINRINEGDS